MDNISWVRGRHTFKFGAEYRESISPQSFTQRVRGDYEWGSQTNSFQADLRSGLDGYLNDVVPDLNEGGFVERSAGNFIYYGNQQSVYISVTMSGRSSRTSPLTLDCVMKSRRLPWLRPRPSL